MEQKLKATRKNEMAVKTQNYVRITGVRDNKFTEFEFSIDDPKLFVELILPFDQFKEFCDRNNVKHLSIEQCAEVEFDQLKWRNGDPSYEI